MTTPSNLRATARAVAGHAPRRRRTSTKWWPAALLVVALVVLWELASRLMDVPEYLFPAPSAILRAGVDNADLLGSAAWVTTTEMVLGLLLAVAVALLIAVALHFSTLLRSTVLPLLIASQTVPVVVLAPILAIAFGYGIMPKLVIVALICFFPLAVGTLDGLRSVDPDLLRLMRTLDASRWAVFCRVEFPSALPQLFSGLRLAATYAAIGAVFGEWSGSTDGLGFVMLQATPQLRTSLVFAAIVVLTAETVTLFLFVRLLEKVTLRWKPEVSAR